VAIAKFKVLSRSDRERRYVAITEVEYSLDRSFVPERKEGRQKVVGYGLSGSYSRRRRHYYTVNLFHNKTMYLDYLAAKSGPT
jgi:hypothetical protein